MYAVIKTGGKQYRVAEGDLVRVERIPGERGSEIHLNEVLLIRGDDQITVGKPTIPGASVSGTIEEQGKGKKIMGLKYKRRKSYRRRWGHRQLFTAVRIQSIQPG